MNDLLKLFPVSYVDNLDDKVLTALNFSQQLEETLGDVLSQEIPNEKMIHLSMDEDRMRQLYWILGAFNQHTLDYLPTQQNNEGTSHDDSGSD